MKLNTVSIFLLCQQIEPAAAAPYAGIPGPVRRTSVWRYRGTAHARMRALRHIRGNPARTAVQNYVSQDGDSFGRQYLNYTTLQGRRLSSFAAS